MRRKVLRKPTLYLIEYSCKAVGWEIYEEEGSEKTVRC